MPEEGQSDKLTDLLQANLERNEEILQISREIKKYMRWQNIWGTIRTLLIVAPIIVGFIYLPPLIKDYIASYQSLLK
jgi:DNA-binding transcriptional LysR family regulator